ncbi:MAG TPA: DUF1996 domain-containing protein [Micromonosporaceae bacterium]|nr:DUF1996 domain-containing protein [Micromonosporaceae bacterium]
MAGQRSAWHRRTVVAGIAVAVVAVVLTAYGSAGAESRRRHWHGQHRPAQAAQPAPATTAMPGRSAVAAPPGVDKEVSPPTGGAPRTPQHQATGDPSSILKTPPVWAGYPEALVRRTNEKPVRAGDGVGAFRTRCRAARWLADDPIVAPGRPGGSHLHMFWGNAGVDAHSTAQSIASTGNGTCRGGTINRSGYWVPALVDTATGEAVAPQTIDVYYKTGYRGVQPRDIRPLPAGLRMVAGNAMASGPQSDIADWGCVNGGAATPAIPTNAQCPSGQIVMNITFPQCWNGRDLDSADHKSHLVYAIPGRGCPAGTIALPEVSYHVTYHVTGSAANLRLSSDMYRNGAGGYSIHGDWFNGWDPAASEAWVKGCLQAAMDCRSHLIGATGNALVAVDF